jgi:hypothetical protein
MNCSSKKHIRPTSRSRANEEIELFNTSPPASKCEDCLFLYIRDTLRNLTTSGLGQLLNGHRELKADEDHVIRSHEEKYGFGK